MGTVGTVTGVGEYLKSQNPDVKVVAVEPAGSPVLSKGTPGAHKIQGIGAGFVPAVLNTGVYDEIIAVENEAAFKVSAKGNLCAGQLVLGGMVDVTACQGHGLGRLEVIHRWLNAIGVRSRLYYLGYE